MTTTHFVLSSHIWGRKQNGTRVNARWLQSKLSCHSTTKATGSTSNHIGSICDANAEVPKLLTLATVQFVFSSHVLGRRVRLGIPLGVPLLTAYPRALHMTTSRGTP